MPFPLASVGAIAAILGTSVASATSIATTVNQFEKANAHSVESKRRASLVVSFAENLLDKVRSCATKKVDSIVVVRSDLNYTLTGSYKERLGSVTIGGWGYSVFAVTNGKIVNHDSNGRGYHNWCVCGNNRQHNNVISIGV